eukprot:1148944-Amorphochlora_amoeboformis.AAC.1
MCVVVDNVTVVVDDIILTIDPLPGAELMKFVFTELLEQKVCINSELVKLILGEKVRGAPEDNGLECG